MPRTTGAAGAGAASRAEATAHPHGVVTSLHRFCCASVRSAGPSGRRVDELGRPARPGLCRRLCTALVDPFVGLAYRA